jgi:hypothetical protein
MYYIPLLAWGIYATVWLPMNMVEPIFGHYFADAWAWIQIPATTAAMGGMWLRHGGQPISQMTGIMLRQDWFGLFLQATGHFVMFNVLTASEIAAFSMHDKPWWIWLAFGTFAITSYVVGTAFLTAQCVLKIIKGWSLQRAVPV